MLKVTDQYVNGRVGLPILAAAVKAWGFGSKIPYGLLEFMEYCVMVSGRFSNFPTGGWDVYHSTLARSCYKVLPSLMICLLLSGFSIVGAIFCTQSSAG